MRQEVRAMATLSDGTVVAANRETVYYARADEPVMTKSRIESGNQSVCPPMTITRGVDDCIVWGEYNSRLEHGMPIRIFASRDGGMRFDIAHTFAANEIRHVHSLKYDQRFGCYWVFTGDYDAESGIGRLSADFRDFDWLARGSQEFRAVDAFDLGDALLYGTDSGKQQNTVVRIDKSSGKHERIQDIDSCCIHCCRCGDTFALSTTVTRAPANNVGNAAVWISRDGQQWTKSLSGSKDGWHATYFQYGSFVLPRGSSDRNTLLISGQALRGYDAQAFVTPL